MDGTSVAKEEKRRNNIKSKKERTPTEEKLKKLTLAFLDEKNWHATKLC